MGIHREMCAGFKMTTEGEMIDSDIMILRTYNDDQKNAPFLILKRFGTPEC